MKNKFNRFALIPTMCTECKMYILFEPYRKADEYRFGMRLFIPVKVCKDCIGKYEIGKSKGE